MLAQLGLVPVLASLLLLVAPRVERLLPEAGQLNLHNDSWDAVQVEVRIGASQNCDSITVAGVRTLKRGKVWAIVSDQGVCWRREANPGDGSGRWTPWASRALLLNPIEDVSL